MSLTPPSPHGLEYRNYQIEGAAHMVSRSSALLADDPGTGKTIQVCGLLNYFDADPKLNVLIVCPSSLVLNWLRELKTWLVRNRMVGIADGGGTPDSEIVIVNYEMLYRPKTFEALHRREWDFIIIDEAHRIKNPESKTTGALLALKAKRRYALTGTPILNCPVEAWPLLYWMDPTTCPSWAEYTNRYCNAFLETIHYKDRYGRVRKKKAWNYKGAANLGELNNLLLSSGMIRRRKADVLKELPPKERQVVELQWTGSRAPLYKEWSLGGNNYESKVLSLAEGDKVGLDEFAKVRREIALAKVGPSVKHIEDLLVSTKKVVVFAHHKAVIAGLVARFGKYGVVSVTGETPTVERDNAVQRFQHRDDIRVFVGNIKAAGVGLTLTAASTVVFVELDPVPGNMVQAEDRCHRIGATDSRVLVQHLVFDGSLDVKLARMLIRKQKLIDMAVEGHNA